ncbi:MAG: hypothetical protein HYZ42_16395, partial [Bacteroidetes bacterium]|nr:hypothetical protein [Bacteroidota bacterium]
MAKVMFTDKELIMMNDSNLMPAKQLIIKKIEEIFTQIGQEFISNPVFENKQFKISKGENLSNQPYVVLDLPQLKSVEFKCQYRMLYWWGNSVNTYIYVSNDNHNDVLLNYLLEHFSEWDILTEGSIWEKVDYISTPFKHFTYDSLLEHHHTNGFVRLENKFNINALTTPEVF